MSHHLPASRLAPLFALAWFVLQPPADLGAGHASLGSTGETDHVSFRAGLMPRTVP